MSLINYIELIMLRKPDGAAMTPSASTHPYKHHRFPGEMISHAVWLYVRFCLSQRGSEGLRVSLPMMDRTTPPISIHIALSVGEPAKKREMSELKDPASLTPKMISRIPPASNASETALCIFSCHAVQRLAQRGLRAAGKRASSVGGTGSVLGTL
jgi:hypothetical protein